MKNFLYIVLLIGCCSAQSGCTSQPPATRTDGLVAAYCACTTQIARLDEEARQLSAEPDSTNQFNQKLQAMQQEYMKVQQCLAPAIIDYGKPTPAEIEQMKIEIGKKCPKMNNQNDLLLELMRN